jgi:parallel beta-helix repeat protein
MRRHLPEGVRRRRHVLRVAIVALMLLATVAAGGVVLSRVDVPPRSLAAYIEHRVSQHGPVLVAAGRFLASVLNDLDRRPNDRRDRPQLRIGVRADVAPVLPPSARVVQVATPEQVRSAIAEAHPGDTITLEPGHYVLASAIEARAAGKPDASIAVRAAQPGTVVVEVLAMEGFVVSAPYWIFENLVMRGGCRQPGDCEHAFHVVGDATHFIARNNELVDFNAHFKVNGDGRRFPDHGLIESNSIRNTAPRDTDKPVTPIDIVAASHWTIRGNLISDFVKAQGDRISYGAFVKGGGSDNRFERNVVLCEDALRGQPGSRVGLSLGGGGSDAQFCRDRACVLEQSAGTIESNLIAFCSDDGVYVNRSAMSRILNNTVIDTGGIVVRFAQSSAEAEGNLVDGAVRSRDGGLIHARDNSQTRTSALYFGRHPQRALFRDALALDLRWDDAAPRQRSAPASASDLCGTERPAVPTYGAFEDFSGCLAVMRAGSADPSMTSGR